MTKEMRIYIPSRGRADPRLQYTSRILNDAGIVHYLVVRPDEMEAYQIMLNHHADEFRHTKLLDRPESCTNLSQTLSHLIRVSAGIGVNCLLLDDDLRFSRRISQKGPELRKADPQDMPELIARLAALLDGDVKMAGISARTMNQNRYPDTVQYCGRQMQAHAIDTEFFVDEGIDPARVICKSDFHMTLCVLEAGYRNAIICDYTVDQASGSNAKGGVSTYRTAEVINEGAELLKQLHPDYVKIVEKATVWKGMSGIRKEVNIGWKKAYKEAKL
jgi:hypothetical protein